MNILIRSPKMLSGNVVLEGSKSISNRLIILRALSSSYFEIKNLSPGDDTEALLRILNSNELIQDVGAAGTTMRFLTSYFASKNCERILTGSERMKKRPIGILVNALNSLGADISYLENNGFPPIKISGKKITGGKISIRSDVSSQFLSSLLMVAPTFNQGIEMHLDGKIASLPYLLMTLKLMEEFGVKYSLKDNIITVLPGTYHGKEIKVEGDWSAASYYFSAVALKNKSSLSIYGLFEKSLQGDNVLPTIYTQLGVKCIYKNGAFVLEHSDDRQSYFEYDFSECPDLAQTVVVTCAALGVAGKFIGLESLKIKETDRTAALAAELKKFSVNFYAEHPDDISSAWLLEGKTSATSQVEIKTYDDHRMAMSFAPLAILHNQLLIRDADVVKKSYPSFWEDFVSIGFEFSSSD